jgi:hypothetical protein
MTRAVGCPGMATIDDVARVARELPAVTEGERHGNLTWFVSGKAFAWDRPFSKADIKRFGDLTPPEGPILAVRVLDLADKEAVLSAHPKSFFTIPHFEGFSAVLITLRTVTKRALREGIIDAWLACAPRDLADQYLAGRRLPSSPVPAGHLRAGSTTRKSPPRRSV